MVVSDCQAYKAVKTVLLSFSIPHISTTFVEISLFQVILATSAMTISVMTFPKCSAWIVLSISSSWICRACLLPQA